jgi:arylsulfatase A-like enzyme
MNNSLLITVDSLRADHVGCYGYERPTTPNVDAMATSASVFESAFAHACATRPSFPTILTSSYPLMYGGYERLSESRTLISEVFDDAGYRTGGFHSNAYLNPEFGYGRGFDRFDGSMTDPSLPARLRQYVKTNLDSDGILYRTLEQFYQTGEKHAGADVGSAYVDADEITDRAIEWLGDGEDDEGFLWVHYMDVHHPYVPPTEHQRAFRDDPIDDRRAMRLRRKFLERPEEVTDEEFDDIVDLYDAEIRFTDAEVGRLLDAIDKRWDDYAVAFTADHGEEFRDHGGFSHRATYYDETIHVPLVVDDGEHDGRFGELVGLLDVAPTLVDAADLDVPENFYGHSLRKLHDDEWPREHVIGNWADPEGDTYGVRTEGRKYVSRGGDADPAAAEEELYDLDADPSETTNVVDDRPEECEAFREIIADESELIAGTRLNLGEVEMDERVKSQLRDLGYSE